MLDRLIEILETARTATARRDRDTLASETDALSADILRHARDDGTDSRGFGALTLAIDGARKAVSDARVRVGAAAEPRREEAYPAA